LIDSPKKSKIIGSLLENNCIAYLKNLGLSDVRRRGNIYHGSGELRKAHETQNLYVNVFCLTCCVSKCCRCCAL